MADETMIPGDRVGEPNVPQGGKTEVPTTTEKKEGPEPLELNPPKPQVPTDATAIAKAADAPPVSPPPSPTPSPEPQKSAEIATDIAKILSGIKLPERRDIAQKIGVQKSEKLPHVYDTSLVENKPPQSEPASAAQPAQNIGAQTAQSTATDSKPPEDATSHVSSLRTLKNDVQHAVHEQNISVVRAAAYEQEKLNRSRMAARELSTEANVHKARNFVICTVIALFLLTGLAALFYVYLKAEESRSVAATPVDASLIFAERTFPLPMDKLSDVDIKRYIAQALNVKDTPLSSIARILPTFEEADAAGNLINSPATIEKFLEAINAPTPPELIRSFSGEFFLGMHTIDKNVPLFIIPVSSYERAFAGMLAWEKTLNQDMRPIFTPVPPQKLDENGLLVDREFSDLVIKNYDVRALVDDSGDLKLMYSFPSRNILIITESPNTFMEILTRLRASRRL